MQVSACVSLVTFGEINDGAAADSAPCIPLEWQVVDVYVQRLVSVTKRFRLPAPKAPRARQQQPTGYNTKER